MFEVTLLILSLLYFLLFNIKGLFLVCVMIVFTYGCGMLFEKTKSKALMILYVLIVLGISICTKSFSGISIWAVMGMSFMMLRCIGYVVDVYSGRYSCEKNFFVMALFIMFFPIIAMGPIVNFGDFKRELDKKHSLSFDNVATGFYRIILGLFKKMIIADRISMIVSEVTNGYYGIIVIFLMLLMYSVQLYCDFSGGIDIAIGMCKILDINVCENFNKPYLSRNIAEFWQRWHMSLGNWFKAYVFYPLSISKGIKTKIGKCFKLKKGEDKRSYSKRITRYTTYVGLMITWCLTGLWHGLELRFLLWGMFNGVFIIINRIREERKHKVSQGKLAVVLQITGTYILVSILRIFDVYSNLGEINPLGANDLCVLWSIGIMEVLIVIIGLIIMVLCMKIAKCNCYLKLGTGLILCMMVIVFGVYGQGYNSLEFIYGRY